MSVRLSTLSIEIGSQGCNLRCPPCISKQTYRAKCQPKSALTLDRIAFLADKFLRVCDGLPYAIITGKGEPTLVPMEEIGAIIDVLYNLHGPGRGLIPEIQTNGTLLNPTNLSYWRNKGLNTVAISCGSHLDDTNSQLLSQGRVHWNLGNIVREAKEVGLLVRLTAVMMKGGLDSPDAFLAFFRWAKGAGVDQVTFRKMGKPRDLTLNRSQKVAAWIDANYVGPDMVLEVLRSQGARETDPLPWALKFSFMGMSVVVTEHMNPPKDGLIRSGIIKPDGGLYGSWDDPADRLV